jgi:DNA-binding NarL/FixJ family response regulator
VVHSGEIWIEQKHLKILINKGKTLPDGGGVKGLSIQDRRIVEFISQGYKNSEIAESLCLSEPTIKAHISRIYKMLKVKNRVQLACMAQDNPMNEA